MAFEITIDDSDLRRLRKELAGIPGGVERVLARAINKTLVFARTRVVNQIAGQLTLRKRDIKNRNIDVRRASFSRPFARLRISGRRVPLIDFRAKQTRRGVSYSILRGQGRKTLQDAFITRTSSGHEGVFVRTGPLRLSRRLATRTNRSKGRKKGMSHMTRPRLPISERFGPSVPRVLQGIREFASGRMRDVFGERLSMELGRQVKVLLEQTRKVAGVAPF